METIFIGLAGVVLAAILLFLWLRQRARASSQSLSQEPAPAATPPPPEPEETKEASEPEVPVEVRAALMVRQAHELTRYLGLEARIGEGSSALYRVTVDLENDSDLLAAEKAKNSQYDCVQQLTIEGDQAVFLLHARKNAPPLPQ